MHWAELAETQGGVISRLQLRSLGHSEAAINGLVYRGRLVRAHPVSVYRVAGAPVSPESLRWVAVLSTGSPLSYATAAEVWELPVPTDGAIHITRFDRRRLIWPTGVRVHRVALEPTAVTERGGLLVTTRTETLLDCLGYLPIGKARTLADRAQQQSWLTAADIQRRLETQSGRWGNGRLRALLPTIGDGAHSQAERRCHELLRAARITGWKPNVAVTIDGERFVIDVAFARERVAIEIDGYGPHSEREVFQRDRTKGNALSRAGWTVIRFTWADLMDRPGYVIATITALLAR